MAKKATATKAPVAHKKGHTNNAGAGRHPKAHPKAPKHRAQREGPSGASSPGKGTTVYQGTGVPSPVEHTPWQGFTVGQLVQCQGRDERFYRITWLSPDGTQARLSHGGGKVPIANLVRCTAKQEAAGNELLEHQPLPEPEGATGYSPLQPPVQRTTVEVHHPVPTEPTSLPRTNGHQQPRHDRHGEVHGGVSVVFDRSQQGWWVISIRNGETKEYLLRRMSAYTFTLEQWAHGTSKTYLVYIGGRPRCGCPDFAHRRDAEHGCKHVKALQAMRKDRRL